MGSCCQKPTPEINIKDNELCNNLKCVSSCCMPKKKHHHHKKNKHGINELSIDITIINNEDEKITIENEKPKNLPI
jgi:hypothetical protein